MGKLFLAKQKIFNADGNVYAYELLFRDTAHGIAEFPGNMKATSHIIINTLTNLNIDQLLGKNGTAFINVDEQMLTSGIIDMLDKKDLSLNCLRRSN